MLTDTIALVTTYNERETIGWLLSHLAAIVERIIVIDDHSTDQTAAIAQQYTPLVFVTPQRIGIAKCLLYGYQRAQYFQFMNTEHRYDYLIQIDAGGSHYPDELFRLYEARCPGLVIGSRYLPGSSYQGNPRRRIMSRLASGLCNLRTGQHITDWTSGYRLFSLDALRHIPAPQHSKMHGYQIEVLDSILRAGLPVVEVPITYQAGRSSFRASTALEAYRAWHNLSRR